MGANTTHGYFYMPDLGASGEGERSLFNQGLQRADTQLYLLSLVQSFYRLRAKNNANEANQIDFTANMITTFNANGTPLVLDSYAANINPANSGLNGLDTGNVAANTWYGFYAIAAANGANAGIASANMVSPTLPVGYTYYKKIGIVRYGASSLALIIQYDREVRYNANTATFANFAAGANITLTDISEAIPIDTIAAWFQAMCTNANNAGSVLTSWDANLTLMSIAVSVPAGMYRGSSPYKYHLNPANLQAIYLQGAYANLMVTGYELDI